MKKFLFICLLIFSCSDDPTPTSIQGDWGFSVKNISGEFKIVQFGTGYRVESGRFSFNNNSYEITEVHPLLEQSPGQFLEIYLHDRLSEANVDLVDIIVAPDFRTMKAKKYSVFSKKDNYSDYGTEEVVILLK